jgi:hypothetical protein
LLETYRCLVLLLYKRDRDFLPLKGVGDPFVIGRHSRLFKIFLLGFVVTDLNAAITFAGGSNTVHANVNAAIAAITNRVLARVRVQSLLIRLHGLKRAHLELLIQFVDVSLW